MSQNLCLHIVLIVTVLASSGVTRSNGHFVGSTRLASTHAPPHPHPDPCSTSPPPCGPNTSCNVRKYGSAGAECDCLDGFVPDGNTIIGCKRQCTRDNDCPYDSSCKAYKCVKVCMSGACGLNADCDSRDHLAICKCPRGYQGRPEIRCTKVVSTTPTPAPTVRDPIDPCQSNPCGRNANCHARGERPHCTCPIGFKGDPHTNCFRGECIEANHCPEHLTCQNFQCIDPCNIPNTCGRNAECKSINHQPKCSCGLRMVGNPQVSCKKEELCRPSPCGLNTNCKMRNDRAVCSCIDNYLGDPHSIKGCRPECDYNSECPSRMACKNNKCVNPCINACGDGAICDVVQGDAKCSCPQFYLGNPHSRCYPECTAHNECPSHQACYQLQCVNPCAIDGVCGEGAECKVENHKPICSCPKGYTGHPFESCIKKDVCRPNPCGLGADCTPGFDHDHYDRPVCSCPIGFIGNALISCQRGECQHHDDCRDSQACYNYTCQNPCYNDLEGTVCGDNTNCSVKNHQPVCSCSPGYIGNALKSCYQPTQIVIGCKGKECKRF